MGRQTNFFMLRDDLIAYEQMIRQSSEVCLLKSQSNSQDPEVITTFLDAETGTTEIWLYLARAMDLEKVVTEAVPTQGYCRILEGTSPVVQFNSGYQKDNVLKRGRLYFQPGYYNDSDCWVEKSSDFIRWADGLLRWIRRHYRRDSKTGYYIGPAAWKWVEQEGGQLNPYG